ncbi:MAG: tetratricopeptide repeat protein [Syntrophobacterales bacterium]|nr:tetratricopeptide repeat protein [Syntrophobacterales bacterium]
MLRSLHVGKGIVCVAAVLLLGFLGGAELYAAASKDTAYRLQIACYRDEGQAIGLTRSMRKLGYSSFYEKAAIEGKGEWYRVYLGRFKTRAETQAAGKKLVRDGVIDNFLVREPNFAKARESGAHAGMTKTKLRPARQDSRDAPRETKTETSKDKAAGEEDSPPKASQDAAAAAQPVPVAQETTMKQLPQDPFFEEGRRAFLAGNYAEALLHLEKILARDNVDKELKEQAQRMAADCHYFLGERGSSRDYLSAIDLYKEILVTYPGPGEENAEAMYRLAKSYVGLNFYYEAAKEFDNLCANYPQSRYVPEALFLSGEMSYRVKRYNDAAERFKEYVRRYTAGEYARKAFFNIADCYSRLQQMETAEQWYRQALTRWPDLESIPRHDILNLGFHHFRNRKYADAADMFFLHLNLFPDDENRKDVLYALARSLMEMQQLGAALKLFGQVIEQYPESKQAWESVVIMANLGVQQPGIKLPTFMSGASYYLDPIGTYDFLLRKFPIGDMTEGLLFQRGQALLKAGRHREAFFNFAYMMQQFPGGRYRAEGANSLILSAERVVDDSYASGDYLFVADIYFKAYEKVMSRSRNLKARWMVGDSLKRVALPDEALKVFGDLLKEVGYQERGRLLVEIADCHRRLGDDDQAEKVVAGVGNSRGMEPSVVAAAKRMLGDIYSRKGEYKKAASLYGEVPAVRETLADRAAFHLNYGIALMETNALSTAKAQFLLAVESYEQEPKRYAPDVLAVAHGGIGDCLLREGNYREAVKMYKRASAALPEGSYNLWALQGMARGYAGIGDEVQVQQLLSSLRDRGGEGFWTQLADYEQREGIWRAKYGKYLWAAK